MCTSHIYTCSCHMHLYMYIHRYTYTYATHIQINSCTQVSGLKTCTGYYNDALQKRKLQPKGSIEHICSKTQSNTPTTYNASINSTCTLWVSPQLYQGRTAMPCSNPHSGHDHAIMTQPIQQSCKQTKATNQHMRTVSYNQLPSVPGQNQN